MDVHVVQSTHPRGVRHLVFDKPFADFVVSIHAPARGATHPRGLCDGPPAGFNPRTREGCDSRTGHAAPAHSRVSIHAPARGATGRGCMAYACWAGFNPRTREGCDGSALSTGVAWSSFNPRTREGCDDHFVHQLMALAMFQSTHPRGVRPPGRGSLGYKRCFNPRTREGCDPLMLTLTVRNCHVSIHAPARGATAVLYMMGCAEARFNPRTREGCDWLHTARELILHRFQSTHPRGVRRDHVVHWTRSVGFNPRTREGCDHTCRHCLANKTVSIHAPARGATPPTATSVPCWRRFQSTHPRGVRQGLEGGLAFLELVSIHAPARGATYYVRHAA